MLHYSFLSLGILDMIFFFSILGLCPFYARCIWTVVCLPMVESYNEESCNLNLSFIALTGDARESDSFRNGFGVRVLWARDCLLDSILHLRTTQSINLTRHLLACLIPIRACTTHRTSLCTVDMESPRHITVNVPMTPPGLSQSTTTSNIICEGWVLKKRRKKMQGMLFRSAFRVVRQTNVTGFARRYFTLQQSGLLSYSFQPGQATRDQILMTQAAISTAAGRRDIHIDSNKATFHMKCLSISDFNMWMSAFRYAYFHLLVFDMAYRLKHG